MKVFLPLLVLILLMSCNKNKEHNKIRNNIEAVTAIDTIKVYNNILNDLIENKLYNKYLGRQWELLVIDLYKNRIDSSKYINSLNSLKNAIVEKDSLKGTLYLDNAFNGYVRDINFLKLPKEFDVNEIKQQVGKKNYLPLDSLKSNFVKIKSLSKRSLNTSELFDVGVLNLSKISFNEEKKLGILYFEFICGSKCGEGSLILIKEINHNWYVEKKYTLWEI